MGTEIFGGNHQDLKGSQLAEIKLSIFLTCHCHKIYRVEAVVLKNPIILLELWFLWVWEIWGNFMKKWYFLNDCLEVWNGSMACSCFPCFRENVVVTCKIGYFLCSLDNLPQKSVIVLFFGNQISKWCSFEKRAIFDLLFTFSSDTYIHLKHIHTHILLTLLTFFALPILNKIQIYQVRFLFSRSPGVDSYSRHFGEQNLSWNIH